MIKLEEIKENVKLWWQLHGYSMYRRPLQVEKMVCLGWLLYSLGAMDKGWLTKKIYKSTEIHVGLWYRIISPKETGPIPADQRVQAYHLEVDALNAQHSKAKLQKFFRTARNVDNPMQICMQLVPPMLLLSDPKLIDKVYGSEPDKHCLPKN